MTTKTTDKETGRSGFFDSAKSWAANLIGTTRSRVDLFTTDVEQRVFRLVAILLWTVVAFFSLSLGLLLAMLAIVFGFDLPPRYAFGIPALILLSVGLVAVWMLRRKKRSKPGSSGKHARPKS